MTDATIRLPNYIGDRLIDAVSETTLQKRNPANIDDLVCEFPDSTEADVESAVIAARKALPGWQRTSQPERAEYLQRLARLWDDSGSKEHPMPGHEAAKKRLDDIARLMARECGKPVIECRNEIIEARHMLEFMAGKGRDPTGEILASGVATRECYIIEQPKGVIASITPWNYPIAIPVWHLAPAVLKGNCVVLKASEEAPMTAYELGRDIERAGFPPGVVNILLGGKTTGWNLAKHPDVDAIIFTGSSSVGRVLQQLCVEVPRKSLASEVGGKNAMVILDDADLDNAIESCALSWLKSTGQRCVSAERLIVQAGIYEKVKQGLLDHVASKLLIDDPLRNDIPAGMLHIGPMINKAAVDKVLRYNALSRQEGGKVLLEGARKTGDMHDKGWYVTPHLYEMTLDRQFGGSARVLQEETFGPHACLIRVNTIDEAIAVHNSVQWGLSVGYCTKHIDSAHRLTWELQAGVGYQNAPCIGAEVHLPFGGVKASGNDRPSGRSLLDFVVHKVARTVQFGTKIQTAYAVEDGRKG